MNEKIEITKKVIKTELLSKFLLVFITILFVGSSHFAYAQATASGQTTHFQPIMRIEPIYPKQALTDLTNGYVLLSFTIEKNGKVSEVFAEEAYPKGIFEKSAINAVKKWKYAQIDQKEKQVKVKLKFGAIDTYAKK
ncbi:energy transducer TonB [Thalassotalea sp. ND16A]|uniref:energy transducer TonB n=1 Tax=Thalassotalea sp. ND16A TaxID=1535422 RepID=UPI00051DE08B|nr:TonB family protein [Thalassotalea sp. ND16A]KGJ89435.1 hypothetical protein ND16A_2328 [Thalassotalea sp. ND16A]